MTGRVLGLLLMLAVGAAGGYAAARYQPWMLLDDAEMAAMEGGGMEGGGTAGEAEPKIRYWVAPMDPNFRSDKPGKSPMGMDLVPVYEDSGSEESEGAVRIDPSVVNNIGVRTATAGFGSLEIPIRTVGRITYDEEQTAQIHVRSNGWIQRLDVRALGEPVAKGDVLFTIYAPELVAAQAEYVQALRMGRAPLIEASRDRLRALGISDGQIREVERQGSPRQYIRVHAPISGVVTDLNAADGKFLTPDTPVMTLADLSRVWLVSAVFEADAGRLVPGAAVDARSAFEPGTFQSGTIDYVYPDLDMVTRTVSARTVLDNTDGAMKPGMYMTVRIAGPPRPETTLVPREALIRTGREERVILALGEGRFQPARVVSGLEAEGKVEILSGLRPGETVVVSSQFLIDSESSFAGATLRLEAPAEAMAMPGGNMQGLGAGMSGDGEDMDMSKPATAMDGMKQDDMAGAGMAEDHEAGAAMTMEGMPSPDGSEPDAKTEP